MGSYNEITDTRYGKMIYNVNDYPIGKSVMEYGEWCQGEIDLLKELIRPGMTVLDAGANIGTHALAFSSLVGKKGKVLAFEPQRLIFYILVGNVAINSIENIWCYYCAVSDERGTIKVSQLNFEASYNFGGLQLEAQENHNKFEDVPTLLIDDLELGSCDLIKADVEGMEERALRGAAGTIEKFRPILYVENERPQKSESLISYIKSLDYELYWHFTPSFSPNNFKANPICLIGGYVPANMLCIPKEKVGNVSIIEKLNKV